MYEVTNFQLRFAEGGNMLRKISKLVLALAAFAISFSLLRADAQTQSSTEAHALQPGHEMTRPDSMSEISARAVVIVREFSVSEKTGWPYDIKQLQSQTVAELRAKSADHLDVLVGDPATPRTHTYTLNGEIVSWRPGNRAKRMMIGMGSGRETADIHYWLTDEQGKKVFDHKDTIRAEFWGNAYAGSVGELAHPFASKIAARLTEAKLF
jgi:hypothetical protein